MEELNKSQIVLLTLLVSFVTSMATGIVTVSLMEQGVSPVTNTVNQIVERTKEVIVKVQEPQETKIITEEKIVKQADLVAAAVAKVHPSTVAIYEVIVPADIAEGNTNSTEISLLPEEDVPQDAVAPTEQVAGAVMAVGGEGVLAKNTLKFVARGVVLAGGIVATDSLVLTEGTEYIVVSTEGTEITVDSYTKTGGVGLLQADLGQAVSLGDATGLGRGVTVVALSGTDRMRVITAIVSDLMMSDDTLTAIEVSLGGVVPGSILIDLEGRLIGISTGASRAHGQAWFSPVSSIEQALHTEDDTNI